MVEGRRLPYFFDMLTDNLRTEIIEKISEFNPEVFVVEASLRRGVKSILILRVDTDKGISMAECSSVSRQLGSWLETHPDFDFPYTLEVSSPGIGAALTMHRQYLQNIGRNLRLVLLDGQQEEGNLEAVTEVDILLSPLQITKGKKRKKVREETADEPVNKRIRFDEIKESKVIISI